MDDFISRLNLMVLDVELLLNDLHKLKHVYGSEKLARKIKSELKFLKKLQLNPHIVKEDHLKSSNLTHLRAIVDAATKHDGVTGLLIPFSYEDVDDDVEEDDTAVTFRNRLLVDVVAHGGRTWLKVIARNPIALDHLSTGQGQYGERNILQQARKYINCAKQNSLYFQTPRICFLFYNGITQKLARSLQKIGVMVHGNRLKDMALATSSNEETDSGDEDCSTAYTGDSNSSQLAELSPENLDQSVQQLNLDVTAMIAYVSALTNGGCNFKFKEKVLSDQAQCELKRPTKRVLDTWFQGRDLYCCETALKDFQLIISTIGGPREQQRAADLLSRVKIVRDDVSCLKRLMLVGKIKKRSLIVFGTGESIRAVTVTANSGFVRSASTQGVNFPALIHESRALTEAKEATAESTAPS